MKATAFSVWTLLALCVASSCEAATPTPTRVSSLEQLATAVKSARPGTLILVADGQYVLEDDFELKRLHGTAEQPITIRAENLHQAEIHGDHVFKLRHCRHLVLAGFRFTLKADVHGKSGAVSVRSCTHCRITRNDFQLLEDNTGDDPQVWLTVDGHGSGHNRIDQNRFANKGKKGHFLFITGEDDYVSQHDLVERNHFFNRGYGNDANEFETIRVGESRIGNRDGKSYTVIRQNFFERCLGEDELISLKVGGCSILDNTILNCHGSVVFRAGSDGVFAGNLVIRESTYRPFEAFRAGGVRFYGSGHRAYNNYFEGLNGTAAKAPLALMHGAPAGSGALGVADGLPATDCIVVHNTWTHCAQLRLGFESKERPLQPKNCVFAHNIVSETADSQLLNLFEADGIEFRDNIVYATHGKETGIEDRNLAASAFRTIDPRLTRQEALFRPARRSPAVDEASTQFPFVQHDFDGQRRDLAPDVGADEYRPNAEQRRQPLDATVIE